MAPVGNSGAVATDSVSVDKIRDLLFGNQMQDYDRRFIKLEERFLQRLKEHRMTKQRAISVHSNSNAKKHVDSQPANCEKKKISGSTATKR